MSLNDSNRQGLYRRRQAALLPGKHAMLFGDVKKVLDETYCYTVMSDPFLSFSKT